MVDEKTTHEQYGVLDTDRLYTEEEAIQEEIVTRIPGFVKLLMQYEWKPLTRIIGAIALIVAVYLLIGWDAVASGVALFLFIMVVSYLIQIKHQERDSTIFVEMKLPGQKITLGDHSPYSKVFYTTEKRFGVWEVPNTLLRNGLFHMPGEQSPSMLPGTDHIVFCDLFDRVNRTCVLPKDMDVANIALVTNANPMLAKRMGAISEQVKLDKKMEKLITDLYSTGQMSAVESKKLLEPISIRQRTLMSPTGETRRDIFFDLQSVIPELREKLQETSNKIFLLADFLAARGIYQSTNRSMPEQIRKNHNFLYKLYGLPTIPGTDSKLEDE